MSALTNERIIVKENDIVERQLSFDNVSVEPAQVKDYDAKPTTRKELIAWYQYSLAADGWTAASSSVFMPLVMSTMGTLGGTNEKDPTKPCNGVDPCYVKLGTAHVSPASYALYVTAIAVLVQAFIYIQLAVVADHSKHGKAFMLIFAYAGSITVLLWAALITNPSNYLPKLARNHPNVTSATDPSDRARKLTLQTSRISLLGLSCGALGGFAQMGIGIGVLYAMNSSMSGLLVATSIGGAWWAIFSLIPLFFLKSRQGPPLPKGETYLIYPWKRLFKTMKRVSHLAQLFKFLLCWFMLSDGIYTILKVSVLFAQTVVHTPSVTLLIGAMVEMIVSAPSYIFWGWIERRFHLKPKTLLMILSFMASMIPVYVLIGFSPDVWGGFKHPNEYIGLCAYFGFTAPIALSYARSTFSELIPIGRENEMFSMFLITQGGGGWIGPLITGVIGDKTGNMRYCNAFILACIILPVIGLFFINVEKGKKEALSTAERDAKENGNIIVVTDDTSS
ncbi:autophagy-related protein 22-like protein [Umbelopsis sp. PMI_123]|nr:autophagy-related protein 22-like protein [Umbelopsis sp. PMI_123]